MHTEREKEVPELQHFRQGRCAGAECEDRGESVDLSGEFVGVEEKGGKMGFTDGEDAID